MVKTGCLSKRRQFVLRPQIDRMASVAGCNVKRFDSLRHVTYIGGNGAVEIRLLWPDVPPTVLLSKPGLDAEAYPQLARRLRMSICERNAEGRKND